jgi:hypothetical protein
MLSTSLGNISTTLFGSRETGRHEIQKISCRQESSKSDFYFSYGLFNNAACSSFCISVSGRMINECWIGSDVEGSACGLM